MTVALWYYQYQAACVEYIETGNSMLDEHQAAERAAVLQADIHGVYVVGYQTQHGGFVSETDWDAYHDALDALIERHAPAVLRCRTRTVATPWPVQGRTDVVDIPAHWPQWIGATDG